MLTWSPLPSVNVIVGSYSVSILWERSCWFPDGIDKLTFLPSKCNGSLCTHPHQNLSLFVVWVTFLLTEMRQNFKAVLIFLSLTGSGMEYLAKFIDHLHIFSESYLFCYYWLGYLRSSCLDWFFLVLDIFYKLFLYKII